MIKIKVRRISTFLDWGILIMCLKVMLSGSILVPYSDFVDTLLTFIAVLLFLVSILQEHLPVTSLFGCLVFGMFSLYSVAVSNNYGFLVTIIACLAMRKHDLNTQLELIFRVESFLLVFHILGAILAHITGRIPIAVFSRGAMRYRFGFVHANLFSAYLFNIIILWTWLNYCRIKLRHLISIFFIMLIATLFTDTRTSFLLMMVFCVTVYMSKRCKKVGTKLLNIVAMVIVPVTAILVLLGVEGFMSGSVLARALDRLLSGRLRLGAYFDTYYGYTFWGQPVSFVKQLDSVWKLNSVTFDNLYTYLAFHQGIVWICILTVFFFLITRNGNIKLAPFIIVWALYGVTEIHGLNGFLCFPVFLLAKVSLGNKRSLSNGSISISIL